MTAPNELFTSVFWGRSMETASRLDNPDRLSRLLLATLARTRASGHAEFAPGELRDILSLVDANGEIHPDTNVNRTIRRGIKHGMFEPGSDARCVRLTNFRGAAGSRECKTCSKRIEQARGVGGKTDHSDRVREEETGRSERESTENLLTQCEQPAHSVSTQLTLSEHLSSKPAHSVSTSDDPVDPVQPTNGHTNGFSYGVQKNLDEVDPDEFEQTLEWLRQKAEG